MPKVLVLVLLFLPQSLNLIQQSSPTVLLLLFCFTKLNSDWFRSAVYKSALVVLSLCPAQYAFLADLHSRRPRISPPSAGTGLLIEGRRQRRWMLRTQKGKPSCRPVGLFAEGNPPQQPYDTNLNPRNPSLPSPLSDK